MQELIKITENDGVQVVNARELHLFLDLDKSQIARWLKRNIVDNDFALENEDYWGSTRLSSGNIVQEYDITIDLAKKICMLSKSQKGDEIREYFLNCEKKLQLAQLQQFKFPQTLPEALRLYADEVEKNDTLVKQIAENKDKVDFFDEVADTTDTFDFITVSGLLKSTNLGRNKFIDLLKEKKILMKDSRPFRKYIDLNYFTLVEVDSKQNGKVHIQTRVTQKGLVWLAKILA